MRIRAAALAALLMLPAVAGCAAPGEPGAPHRARFLPARLDRGIERYDFANATWKSDAGKVTLHDGHLDLSTDGDPQSADLSAGPVYADVDGDGAEDAALALHTGGQGFTIAWYVWLWKDGTAVQLPDPFSDQSRCGGQVLGVTPAPGAFQVKELLFSQHSDCATAGTTPVTYQVAVRDGFVVEVAPVLGPVPICDPQYFTVPVTLSGPVTPRAAADDRAPAIATDQRYQQASGYDTGGYGGTEPWVELLLDDGTHPPSCGWLHSTDVSIP